MAGLSTEEVENYPSSAWQPLVNVKALAVTGDSEATVYTTTAADHRKGCFLC